MQVPHTSREERFLRLLNEHKGILYKVANAYSKGQDERNDLEQEIILHLWKAFPKFDERLRFSTWMYRVALNVAISSLRSRKKDWVSLESALEHRAADEVASGDEIRILREMLAGLDELSRALMLLYLEGYTHAEIGEILGLSATNVGTRISRITASLQKQAAVHELGLEQGQTI